jgi:formate dehydrogenase subunit beta
VVKALMEFAGLDPQRLRLDWVSASEGERFSNITNEFVNEVRALGPLKWRVGEDEWRAYNKKMLPTPELVKYMLSDCSGKSDAIRAKAKELLINGQVGCVIGYEVGPRGRTRPVFIYQPEQVERLVWNPDCTHNLTTYLRDKLRPTKDEQPSEPVAVVVKACDSRAINVMLAENAIEREQVYALGVICEGIRDNHGSLQSRCTICSERVPLVFDALIGESSSLGALPNATTDPIIARLDEATPGERLEYWLSQFDRCIRCYACRQACPMCDCPTCLYERDDSLWVGMGIGVNEKRTFHLGRAYHVAGRCIGCNECERVCPMNIPIGYLNQKLVQELEKTMGYRAGLAPIGSPIVTVLAGEYKEG